MTSAEIIRAYYEAFNAGDMERFLGMMTEDVEHDISQGEKQVGRDVFRRFMEHMNHCYREQIKDLVVMTEPSGERAAAEFTVHGTYLRSDPGVPEGTAAAHGQTYVLPAGAFFTLRGGKVARISNHYNLGDWIRQVGAGA